MIYLFGSDAIAVHSNMSKICVFSNCLNLGGASGSLAELVKSLSHMIHMTIRVRTTFLHPKKARCRILEPENSRIKN